MNSGGLNAHRWMVGPKKQFYWAPRSYAKAHRWTVVHSKNLCFKITLIIQIERVKTVKFLTLTEEIVCGFTGRETTVSASLLSYYLCLKICFIKDTLFYINSLFLLSMGRMTSASIITKEPKILFIHMGLNSGNSISPEECH
jgi:hypothetical protein